MSSVSCQHCNGDGQIVQMMMSEFPVPIPCRTCRGTGFVDVEFDEPDSEDLSQQNPDEEDPYVDGAYFDEVFGGHDGA